MKIITNVIIFLLISFTEHTISPRLTFKYNFILNNIVNIVNAIV